MTHNKLPPLISPSWVIPGTYAENLRFLEDKKEIAGVELLFFIYDDEIKNQLDSEWEEIRRFRERFIFTAHLPEKLLPAHEELVARLAPQLRHFIVHPPRENPGAQAKLLAEWAERYGCVFLAENIGPGLLEALLPHLDTGTGLCMDSGHLLLEGKSPAEFFAARRDRVGEIHLHGVDREAALHDGRLADHRRLRGDETWLAELLPLLDDYRGIINLEVFSWEEVRAGIEALRKIRRG
jgi:sugar phosphate isomerase/epimerase